MLVLQLGNIPAVIFHLNEERQLIIKKVFNWNNEEQKEVIYVLSHKDELDQDVINYT